MKELLKISHIQEAEVVLLMVLDKLLERRVRLDQVQEPPTGPGAEESSKGTGNRLCSFGIPVLPLSLSWPHSAWIWGSYIWGWVEEPHMNIPPTPPYTSAGISVSGQDEASLSFLPRILQFHRDRRKRVWWQGG